MDELTAIADPATVLVGLGAACGLVAATQWVSVTRSIDTGGEVVKGPNLRALAKAAAFTALALGLASLGFLLGHFIGKV